MKASSSQAPPPADGVRLIVFDFDQTLSVIHVFKTLAGWSKDSHFQVPKPHATTERGQVRRIQELSQIQPFKSERGGFATIAFGGDARVDQIRELLERLQAREVNMVICTKGLVGTVRKCLTDLGLLNFFSEVYGNVGDNYGETPYDKELMRCKPTSRELQYISGPDKAQWKSKDSLIDQLARRAGLSKDQAVLVEDDAEEIRRAQGVCRTLWVKEAAGMTPRHCAVLLQLVEGGRRPSHSGGAGDDHPRERAERARGDSLARSGDSRFSERRLEARHRDPPSRGSEVNARDMNNSRDSNRRFEEGPGNVSLEGSSRMELDISRLTIDDDCRPAPQGRRSKSCVDAGAKANRRVPRPVSRGSHSRALQAAGARMFATIPVD